MVVYMLLRSRVFSCFVRVVCVYAAYEKVAYCMLYTEQGGAKDSVNHLIRFIRRSVHVVYIYALHT